MKRIDYSLDELAKALLEREGIRQGYWTVAFNIHHTGGMFGEDPAPGMMFRVTEVYLAEVSAEFAGKPRVIDASKLRGKKP